LTPQGILVGDVGGTNVRLAVARINDDGHVDLSDVMRMPVAQTASLSDAIDAWSASGRTLPSTAVFALAGTTGADEVRFTNSNWVVSASDTHRQFGFKSVTLVNDFAAQARAVPANRPEDFETLIEGTPLSGAPVVVLGPGTGLGMAILMPEGDDWRVIPTEAGHQAYGPCSPREREILGFIAGEMPYVSYENLVSGLGLDRLYQAICALDGKPARLRGGEEIGSAAMAGDDPCAVEAATIMTLSLATFAGNAILASGAKGGCVIAGGVAEALAPFLCTQAFRDRLTSRGAISSYFDNVPVRRARDSFAALEGAAFFAPKC
jgi:glucokinase